ncbi:MAG: divergent polysaccharide deacetylase family protein [Gammaproteobacteria bacterium]|nr:divergent polysaccharide deacetylase family protein [Gammaproteobacteria bacterium]
MAQHFHNKKVSTFFMLAFFFCLNPAKADSLLTIVIDDIGHSYKYGSKALSLPGNLTYALLPYSAHAQKLYQIGLTSNKEFILHSPMQSIDNRLITKHTLHIHMTEKQFASQLQNQLAQFPFIKGINNHMGSLLTRHAGYMDLLMRELTTKRNLYFLDSRTSEQSVAIQLATEHSIPHLSRDVFLDNEPTSDAINRQFDQAIELSKAQGYAVVIGHPYPATIKVLSQRIPQLSESAIKLVTASTLISRLQEQANEKSTDTTGTGLRRTGSNHAYRLAQKSRH